MEVVVQRRGRPRDPARRDAVLESTRTLLAEVGYDALTYADVATTAGVGRQLLYRWWPDKRLLVAEALFADTASNWPAVYQGPLEKDLRAFVSALLRFTRRSDVLAGTAGLAGAEPYAPAKVHIESFVTELTRSFALLVEGGKERGEVRSRVDVTMLLDTVRGAALVHVWVDRNSLRSVNDHLVWLLHAALVQD